MGLLPIPRRTGVNAAGLPRRLRHFVALLPRLAGRGKVPRPSISGISPKSATAGSNSFLLSVDGSDFRRDSAVSWNGSFRVMSFVSSDRLVAAITAADIAQPGAVLVFVFNPPESDTTSVSGAIGVNTVTVCSGKDSNAVPFTVNP